MALAASGELRCGPVVLGRLDSRGRLSPQRLSRQDLSAQDLSAQDLSLQNLDGRMRPSLRGMGRASVPFRSRSQ